VQCRPLDRPRAQWPTGPHAGSVTNDDDDRRQTMTDASQQNNTGPLGEPVITLISGPTLIESDLLFVTAQSAMNLYGRTSGES